MAKASSKTSVYEIRSANSLNSLFVTERALIKIEKVGVKGTKKTDLSPTARDDSGRAYERIAGMRFRCVVTGELFHIVEQAPSIRKVSA